jgi:SPP1 family predicted phage head-tail adaptor
MRAGDYRHRLIFQIPQRSKNSMGEWVDTFADWATVWAAVEPNTGRRYFEALQASAEAQGLCRIRYRKGVLPTMRISYEGRTLLIVSIVQPREKREELHIYYRELLD